jgi:hypothetical protein
MSTDELCGYTILVTICLGALIFWTAFCWRKDE